MTTLTIKEFARKLGFKRASDPRFRTLLKQWEIEGVVKTYQGGYRGHSTSHPKKATLITPLHKLQLTAQQKFAINETPEYNRGQLILLLRELGLKYKRAGKPHSCTHCGNGIDQNDEYASASFFFQIKLCSNCIGRIVDNPKIRIRPLVIIGDKRGTEKKGLDGHYQNTKDLFREIRNVECEMR